MKISGNIFFVFFILLCTLCAPAFAEDKEAADGFFDINRDTISLRSDKNSQEAYIVSEWKYQKNIAVTLDGNKTTLEQLQGKWLSVVFFYEMPPGYAYPSPTIPWKKLTKIEARVMKKGEFHKLEMWPRKNY